MEAVGVERRSWGARDPGSRAAAAAHYRTTLAHQRARGTAVGAGAAGGWRVAEAAAAG